MNRFYVIAILFGVGVAISTWLSVKHERDAGRSSPLERAFPRFMIFLAAGIAILVGIVWVIDSYDLDLTFEGRTLAFLAIVLALPVYFITRRVEPVKKRIFERRSSIILVVFALPVAFYWALMEGMDPILIAPLAFISTIVCIILLSRSLWKD